MLNLPDVQPYQLWHSFRRSRRSLLKRWKTFWSASQKLLLLFVFTALYPVGGTAYSAKVDSRDFGVDTYYPTFNEIRIAEQRARRYWKKNSVRVGTEPRYLAVEASFLLAPELGPEFSIKLDRSETSGAYFSQGISSSSRQGISGVVIFDTLTGHSVGPQGYIVVDAPSRGQVVRIAHYISRYIGTGN